MMTVIRLFGLLLGSFSISCLAYQGPIVDAHAHWGDSLQANGEHILRANPGRLIMCACNSLGHARDRDPLCSEPTNVASPI